MNLNLRPYQALIVDHILRTPMSAVFAGMGMGKTSATLKAVVHLQQFWGEGKCLVLAPLRVAQSTWPDEIAKWDDFKGVKVSVICGSPSKRLAALKADADIYTTNYENLPWLLEHVGGADSWPFPIVVADESTRLKSYRPRQGGARAKVLGEVRHKVKRLIELTGTPAPNGLEDLWGQIALLDGGERLGKSMTAFRERFFHCWRIGGMAFAIKWEPIKGADVKIRELISDLTLTLNAEDWFDIKQPIFSEVRVHLPEKAMKIYKSLERDMLADVDEETQIEAMNAAVKTGKCLQIASGAVYDEGSDGKEWTEIHDAKIQALKSIVEEAAGANILVAYTFRHELPRIMKAFPKARVLDKNPQTIRDWNAGKIPMLLAHPASCGHGLSLQDGGHILVFFSTGWGLEEHEQIIERIGPTRQAQAGHPCAVYVYSIVADKTLDEDVQERIKSKRRVLDILLEKKSRLEHEAL